MAARVRQLMDLGFTHAEAGEQASNERRRAYIRAIQAGATQAEIARIEGLCRGAIYSFLHAPVQPPRLAIFCGGPPEVLRRST